MKSRSPLLLSRNRSALLVIDVQEKLVPAIEGSNRVVWNIDRLVRAATLMQIPIGLTEQYPQGLGPTVSQLTSTAPAITKDQKRMFSCRECAGRLDEWREKGVEQLVVAGIEAHVCVLQSALDLVAQGFDVFVVADAVGSRANDDRIWALERLMLAGATVVTTEMVLFEWCETSDADEFKSISAMVRETAP